MLIPLRIATIHPALAHFTIGGMGIIVIAYAVAAWKRSTAWTFAGDVAAGITAALTIATLGFGLISNAIVPWPGGLELWRWLHLGFGIATALALSAFAFVRWFRAPKDAPSGWRTALVAFFVMGVVTVTGWIGGEVLVFHAGIAVRAAGEGAFSPPLSDDPREAEGFLDAMREVRAGWGGINTELAFMLVQKPRDEGFERIARDAVRVRVFANEMAKTRDMTEMARGMAVQADEIAEAARKKDLAAIAKSSGELSEMCADCHVESRW